MGMDSTGLEKLIKTGYELLGLCTYFTSGPKETRAWTITNSTFAPEAAGKIHTDFKRFYKSGNGELFRFCISWRLVESERIRKRKK